eukprot:SAG31_NODE_871_length_11335_cov_4.910822_12_plen_100_part_00
MVCAARQQQLPVVDNQGLSLILRRFAVPLPGAGPIQKLAMRLLLLREFGPSRWGAQAFDASEDLCACFVCNAMKTFAPVLSVMLLTANAVSVMAPPSLT